MRSALSFSLSLALLLSANLAIETVSGAMNVAQAVEYTPRIKRIKIKKKRTGSWRVVATTSTNNTAATVPGKQNLTVSGETISAAPVPVEVDNYLITSADVRASGAVSLEPGVYKVQVVYASGRNGVVEFGTHAAYNVFNTDEGLSDSDDWSDAESEFKDLETRAAIEALPDGTFHVRGSVKRVDGGDVSDTEAMWVNFINADGEIVAEANLKIDEVIQRWTADATIPEEAALDAGQALITSNFYDGDNVLLDSVTSRMSLDNETATASIDKVKLSSTSNGNLKVVSTTSSPDTIPVVLETLVTKEGSDELLFGMADEAATWTERHYAVSGVRFEEMPQGEPYTVVLDALRADGTPGTQFETVIYPRAYTDEDTELDVAEFADGAGQLFIVPASEEGDWLVHVRYADTDVENVTSFGIIFEEPYEGPAPLDVEVSTPFSEAWYGWTQRSSTPMPEGVTLALEVCLTDNEGTLTDVVKAQESEGVAYKSGQGPEGVDVLIGKMAGSTTKARTRSLRSKTKMVRR